MNSGEEGVIDGGKGGDKRPDVVEESLRVAEEADWRGLALRLLGGVAVRVRARGGLHPAFRREYADLDCIVPRGRWAEAGRLFESLGYAPHTRFNAINGRERLLFFDEERDRQVDVLVGSFRMSHEIPFGGRLDLEPVTIPLAELLLTKLQTGKALVPIVEEGAGRWRATLLENRREFGSEEEVKEFEEAVMRRGYYPFRTDPDALAELESDERKRDKLFHKEMLGGVERWMRMADEKLEGTGVECFVSPGNDDQFEVDEIVASAKRVRLAEGRVVEFGDFQMVSTGWANRTPWDTYREEDEPDLKKRLEEMTSRVTAPPEKTVYNFHCPPYASGLDDAPELTEDLRPKHGGRSTVQVGSRAVREVIEEGQPALSLHGHIHEAKGSTRIGRTLSINPGSSYEQGQLLGAMVDLDGGKKVKRFILTSG